MKVEERIEEYLCGDFSYQNISDFYCRNGNAPQWSRWDTPMRRSGRGSRNQASRALRTCNGHGACCMCVAVWDHEVAVKGLKESFSVSNWDPGERATEERYARRSTG